MTAEQADFLNELREYFLRQDADHNGSRFIANEGMLLLGELNRLFPPEES
jgi:hypothetical protein